MSLLSTHSGHLTNLSTAPAHPVPIEDGATVLREHISGPIVQSKCVACHVAGGLSGNTRLVFVPSTTPAHQARNLAAFRTFVDSVDDAAALILNKIQGVAHGGGVQVAAGTPEFAHLERFLALLGEDVASTTLTPQTLFDTVKMGPWRNTLRCAALVFAGRIPTDAEYAAAQRGGEALRSIIRGLMTGPEFHEFLPARRTLCPGPADFVPEFRRVFRHRRCHPLHPDRQCGSVARDRHPRVDDGGTSRRLLLQRGGLGGAPVGSCGDCGTTRICAGSAAGRSAPPGGLSVVVRLRGVEGLCGRESAPSIIPRTSRSSDRVERQGLPGPVLTALIRTQSRNDPPATFSLPLRIHGERGRIPDRQGLLTPIRRSSDEPSRLDGYCVQSYTVVMFTRGLPV